MKSYIDLTVRFNKTFEREKPQIGKYRASELYYLLKELPENFFKPKDFTMAEKAGMWRGTGKHKMIQELLPDCQCEKESILTYCEGKFGMVDMVMSELVKIEIRETIKNGGFILSGHCDVITPQKEIWDIKCSRNGDVRETAYASQIYQLKLYLSMFECSHGKIVQPIFNNWNLKLKVLAEVERNDAWFQKETERLAEYHKKLIQLKL